MRDCNRGADISSEIDHIYNLMDGSDIAMEYSERHSIKSQAVLTAYDDEVCADIAHYLSPRIEGRTVVEIGGGIGLLAFHLGMYARRVYCIEANPAWAWTFIQCLYERKPKNVSYLFGSADEFIGRIKGNVAIFCTHSGVEDMHRVGLRFADTAIDVYGEIIEKEPEKFDSLARTLRKFC